jgi:tetratricopeptide (TPR) repeat protein
MYSQFQQWNLALEAIQVASRLSPNDMDLQGEARDMAARRTMKDAGYDKQGSFRDQVKDMDSQLRLLDSDKEINDQDALARRIVEAEKELAANPNEPGKLSKLVDLLVQTEKPENEEKAVKILQEYYDKTKTFRFRLRIGQIRMKQMQRQERAKRATVGEDPVAKKEYAELLRKLLEFELSEFKLAAEAYPTELSHRFEMGKRQLKLHRFDDAIASFQVARNNPSHRNEAQTLLGRAFFEADYLDEADETFATLIREFPNRESVKFLEMNYWRGRTLEKKNQPLEAIKLYSTIFQVDSGFRDVAARIKKLRSAASEGSGEEPPVS